MEIGSGPLHVRPTTRSDRKYECKINLQTARVMQSGVYSGLIIPNTSVKVEEARQKVL